MISSLEQTNGIWAQLNEEFCSFPITGIDTSNGNLFMYINGAKSRWAIICGGTVKIASRPPIENQDYALRPEYLVNHNVNYLRPTYDTVNLWEIEPADKFMSIDDVTIEFTGRHFSFLLQIEKLGVSMLD